MIRRAIVAAAVVLSATVGPAVGIELVWHAETPECRELTSHEARRLVNPASVVKIATAAWALETFGPDHRYATRFALTGPLDRETGTVAGDLVVSGGGDPDFQIENGILVTDALARLGVRTVAGDLVVDDRFWAGWESGSDGRLRDPEARALRMARRLRRFLDPTRWSGDDAAYWRALASRRPGLGTEPPRVVVAGGVGRQSGPAPRPTLVHRSNRLATVLKRFLSWSLNDIERLPEPHGGAAAVEEWVEGALDLPPDRVTLATASGLGTNRMSSAAVVDLLHLLPTIADTAGLDVEDLLPMPGCDPGSVVRTLPRWCADPRRAGSAACKTGALVRSDGGVASLAGYLYGREGTAVFMVAAPGSGARLAAARTELERWSDDLLERLGGAAPRPCGASVEPPDREAVVTVTGSAGPPAVAVSPPRTPPTPRPAPSARSAAPRSPAPAS